jgi:pimeloyl-ACP methyl ester carboxylesterase
MAVATRRNRALGTRLPSRTELPAKRITIQPSPTCVSRTLGGFGPRKSLSVVLVGHSGAGPLLPCIAEAINRPVVGLVFVDAGIPKAGASRLDLLADETSSELADKLRAFLESGGSYPVWRDAELGTLIPDARTRQEVLQEMKAQPLAYWNEPLHVPEGLLTIPCGYLRLSDGYSAPAAEAQRRGWPYRELDKGHFHMVVDPEVVASELIGLLTTMGFEKWWITAARSHTDKG